MYSKRFATAANNGLKVVDTGSTATSIVITGGLTVESTPPSTVSVDVVGVQGTAGDIEIDSDGNITSTTLDFTTMDATIYPGQYIWVGGFTSATSFATADYTGLARVRSVTANKITIDKRAWTVGAADDGATKTIQLFIGSFIRNVPQNHADFQVRTYTIEAQYPNVDQPGGLHTEYEYANGCQPNEITISQPLSAYATINPAFVKISLVTKS